jgi:hypothetical protein
MGQDYIPAPSTDGEAQLCEPAIRGMAALLAEGLARQCICHNWDSLEEGDRQALMVVCEWLLMDWDLLMAARAEHIAPL